MLRAAACWRHQGGVIARRALFPRASLSRVLPQALMMQMSTLPDGVSPMTMPALSPTMTAGTVAAWLKKEGEALRPGDVLCQVQTDKAVVDYEVQDDAVLAKILVKEGGEEVPVGTTLAFTVEDEDTFASLTKSGALAQLQADAGSEAAPEATPEPASTPAPKEAEAEPHRQPLIKFLGKRSLLPAEPEAAPAAAAAAPTASASATTGAPKAAPVVPGAPVASEDFVDMALSNMRKVVAKRLSASKSEVPHHYASIDCEIDDVLAFRKTLKKKHDIRVSLNDIMVRAVALALRDVPEANCTFDTTTQTVKPNPSVDISVAVATAAGLITPIVPHVDALGLAGVNTKLVELIQKARENRLKLEEFQGGSFTISNLGGFGIDNFSAVINPPQSCILAIGRGRQELLPGNAKSEEDGEIQPRVATLLNVTLSADRRVVDDVVAGEFLQAFKMYMENPELLTL